ncbi:MAG: ROK family protein [Treponema sp.]|jgi:predicted NBD/HSP70 family sugar kinase|nr:ROK family protein [Treponema sp.]
MKLIVPGNTERLRHQRVVKESNIKQVFDLVFGDEGISRIEISKKTRLSRSTVSLLTDELIRIGLIKMTGSQDSETSGRKGIKLEINAAHFQFITLGLKKEYLRYALYDLKGNEIESFNKKIIYKKGCGKKIWNHITKISKNMDRGKVLAICASIPAKINNQDKTVDLSVLDIEENCELLRELKSMAPELPLLAGNQSSAYAYAEYTYTFHDKGRDLIYFNIDEGVAAGILINGKVFTGEIGHMSIDPQGVLCSCGRQGCLENIVGRNAILREFVSLIPKNPLLRNMVKSGELNYGHIKKAIDIGDRETIRTAGGIAEKIAFGISNVICMFDPERILLGGGIEELGDAFLHMILAKVRIPGDGGICSSDNSHISYAALGSNADLKGVFRYFLDNIFTITRKTENKIHGWN